MIRLICIDVDGTLVGASGVVDECIWRAAARARKAGVRLALCSGRAAFGLAREYASRLDPSGWHCFQNGASVVHVASGESRSTLLPEQAVRVLIDSARATKRILELYSDDDYVCESTDAWAWAHADLLGAPYAPRSLDSLRNPVVRAQWLLSAAEAPNAPRPQGLEMAQSTSPLMPDTVFVGLTRAGISKATAVRAIAGEYGVALNEVMYVGDAHNDVSAMQVVGFPVAMANAPAEVREHASRVVAHVDDNGLAEALEWALVGFKPDPQDS